MVEAKILTNDPRLEAIVFDPAGRLRLMVVEHDTPFPNDVAEYPLPRVFPSLDELQNRPSLKVFREFAGNGEYTRDTLTKLLEGFDCFVGFQYPGYEVASSIKIYERYPPGREARTHDIIRHAYDLDPRIGELVDYHQKVSRTDWTGGFTSNVWVIPENKDLLFIQAMNGLNVKQPIEPMTLPLFDFDTQYADNPQKEQDRVIEILRANGFSGWVASTARGTHFISDSFLPYSPGFWQSLGLIAMLTLSPDHEFDRHREYAERMYKARSLEEAQIVGDEILSPNGIPNTDTAAGPDLRYAAHQLQRTFSVLRSESYWKSPRMPRVTARIY